MFYEYKAKIDDTLSTRRYQMNSQKNLLQAATAALGFSLLLLFLFNFGFKREFCFVATNIGWFVSFLAMIALFMASSVQQQIWMETKDYCTKENQNNFSKFERDVYSAIMLKYETFTAASEVHLFA